MIDFFKEAAANGLGSLTAVLVVKLGELFCARVRGHKNVPASLPQGVRETETPQNSNINEGHSLPVNANTPKFLKLLRNKYILIFVFTFISISIISVFTPLNITGTLGAWIFGAPPEHEKWIGEAWDAMGHKNPTQAIGAAEKVIDNYADDAAQQEEELERKQEPPPPIGSLEGNERERIFARGLLNDVATAYWVAGQAYEQMGNFAKACEDYRNAARLQYARTWDPARRAFRRWNFGGQFWSPAMRAAGRVRSKCGGYLGQ